jgi:hypothetical protein
MNTPRRLAIQSLRVVDYSHLVSAAENDLLLRLVGGIRHRAR